MDTDDADARKLAVIWTPSRLVRLQELHHHFARLRLYYPDTLASRIAAALRTDYAGEPGVEFDGELVTRALHRVEPILRDGYYVYHTLRHRPRPGVALGDSAPLPVETWDQIILECVNCVYHMHLNICLLSCYLPVGWAKTL